MNFFAKPEIEISLVRSSDAPNSYVTSFSTLDQIEGFARIVAKKDTKFDDLRISFVGKSSLSSDRSIPVYLRRFLLQCIADNETASCTQGGQ